MPGTFAPITDEVLAGVRQGDESALERLFREHYDALCDEATSALDDASSAPKVVETAMLRAWERRAEFQNPAELEAFLHGAVHEGAIREKSRKASLHRLESHEAVPHVSRKHDAAPISVDAAWAQVHAVLHAPPPSASHAKKLKDASRHAAAEHMASVAKHRPMWVSLAYGAAIVAAVAGILFGIFRETPEAKVTRFLKSPDARDIITKFGQTGNVTLDDGTIVTLGADSRLLIPPGYPTSVRAVRVTGTGSFQVTPAGELPFEVRLGEAAVVATGTKFSVNFDTATSAALVRVDEGTVDVRSGETIRSLTSGQALMVDGKGVVSEPDQAAIDEALAWTNGRLVIVDRTLRQALEQTRRWYAIALIPSDMSLMERKVSVNAPLDSSTVMIADLERTGNMKFGWEDKTMVLYDVAKAPKPKGR